MKWPSVSANWHHLTVNKTAYFASNMASCKTKFKSSGNVTFQGCWVLEWYPISKTMQNVSSLGLILLVFTRGLRTMPGRPSARMLRIARCRYFAERDTHPEIRQVGLSHSAFDESRGYQLSALKEMYSTEEYAMPSYAIKNLAQRLFGNLFASRTCMQSSTTWLHAASANPHRAKWPLLQGAKCRRKDAVQHGSMWWLRKGLQILRPQPTQLQTEPNVVMMQVCSLSSKTRQDKQCRPHVAINDGVHYNMIASLQKSDVFFQTVNFRIGRMGGVSHLWPDSIMKLNGSRHSNLGPRSFKTFSVSHGVTMPYG